MYSPAKIIERLESAKDLIGYMPEYHSVDEVDQANRSLSSTYGPNPLVKFDEKGRLQQIRPFTAREARWVRNERTLCACDAGYWISRYAYIKDEQNVIKRFAFRIPQKIYYDIISDLDGRASAIELLVLKARQLGMSTITELLIGHRIFFGHGINAVIGSADRQKSGIMSQMVFLAYDMMPWWLKPEWTRRVESDQGMLVFGGTNSGVSIQHGNQMSGIARGTTPTVYHLSEVASFSDALNQIEASLFKAVHASPNVFGVLESTAEGATGWWPDTWRYAKENWPLSRLCPLFLPWFCGTDIYPTPTWMSMRPIPKNWKPNHDTKIHISQSEIYVNHHPLLKKYLLELQKGDRRRHDASTRNVWKMPLEQQWYWEINHEEAKAKGTESTFYQEMAGDDVSCFISSYDSVFGRETIADIDTRRVRGYQAYAILGQSIESTHEPSSEDIDYSQERIPLRWANPNGDRAFYWELIPILSSTLVEPSQWGTNTEQAMSSVDARLLIFHPPEPGYDYTIGIDTGGGKGQDATAFNVIRKGRSHEPDKQVAEFSSAIIGHIEIYPFIAAVAVYYAKYFKESDSPFTTPLLSPEMLEAWGDTLLIQLRKLGFNRFFKPVRYDNKKINKSKSNKLGWFTNVWSRPMLIDGFVHSAQNGWIEINSPWTIHEMRNFEVHFTARGKEKMEHSDESHDDRIVSLAIATFTSHDMDSMTLRAKTRFTEQSEVLPPVALGPCSTNKYSTNPDEALTMDELEFIMSQDRYQGAI